MLSSTFTEVTRISAVLEAESEESVNYDEFGNTLKDASTTEYEDSCSLYECETIDELDQSSTEGKQTMSEAFRPIRPFIFLFCR